MKVSLILVMGLAIAAMLRTRSAALRHWVLAVAITCAAATPLLVPLLPAWALPLPARMGPRLATSTEPVVDIAIVQRTPANTMPAPASRQPSVTGLLVPIWIGGTMLGVCVLVVGLGRLAWLASNAQPPSARLADLAKELAAELQVDREVRLLESAHPSLLATWGWKRPKIILPAAAAHWPEDVVRIVLCHELAHIKRADWAAQMLGELLRAAYWFNPVVWLACARLRLESERACDDEVLSRGVEGSAYATHLVALARDLGGRRAWVPASTMARPSTLHRRVAAMLNDRLDRNPIRPRARISTVALMLVAAAAIAAAQTFNTFSGSLVDPQGAVLPGARVTVSNEQRQIRYEVPTMSTGEFTLPGLSPGDYVVEVQLPGFQAYRGTVTIRGEDVRRDLTLQVGTLNESITVDDAIADGSGSSARPAAAPRPNPACGAKPAVSGLRVGGNLRPPHKLKDVRPIYPAELRGTGTTSEVILDAVIGLDGFIKDIQPREGAQPAFVDAMITAVRQWQFDSTLLNCVPIEVAITINGRFVPQR
jgi:beta-lactamase regulating signal transducer with metallopeptidase domain